MKSLSRSVLFAVATAIVVVAGQLLGAQEAHSSPSAVFLGHWVGGGTFFDTQLSKAGKVTSKGDCEWSPQRRYVICEQTITDSQGVHGQLTVFSTTNKPDEVRYSTFNDVAAPVSGIASIHDNVWTFSGDNTRDGITTTVRTTNTFEADKESFRVEYSQDKGAHWTTMLEGEQHRVK
jgi:hypothetical protein